MTDPRREDVETIDGIIKALYATISGPAGPRDWERERSLFAPGARLQPTRPNDGGGGGTLEMLDVEGYIASRGPVFAQDDFYEAEVARREERFGNIAQAWSTYEYRRSPDDPAPFGRGINSIQLFHDGDRWWIVSVLWDNERPGNPLPEPEPPR